MALAFSALVAFKLSRRKTDDTLKLLHTVLFGRRGKAVQIKSNISRFSGFVWHENEEKQMTKVKEKFDKCNKDKLLEFCDVLDIPLAKATTRKEDIVAKLIDFLVDPQVTTTMLLAENEKGKKRKRTAKRGSSRSGTTSRRSAKSQKKNEDSSVAEERKDTTETENESEEEEKKEENEKENENDVPDKSEDEMPEQSESDDKSESDNESEDLKKPRKINKTSSTKKESAAKSTIRKITFKTKTRSAPKRISKKSLSTHSESDDDSEGSPKVSSRRKKNEKRGKQKTSTLTKSSSKEKTEKAAKGKGKNKLNPSDDKLRDTICEILKEVDFNTATFTDILKQLDKKFNIDLTPRKASIKVIIQEELTKLAEADEDEEGDAENDETQSTGQEVEA
ncbi:DEK domain-containing chromatin-associated protein 4-like [Gastrolobium bilobum]|uniref:DEK domain-containing chromatin-associated protein 4-like n=1 Tax=Gastrolobium bilobum TaxID=150636 RepID=UPI002AB323ED|nr:DEK domain-containing chromatin-associated protein 4-like [Gastrolobium bilobum]